MRPLPSTLPALLDEPRVRRALLLLNPEGEETRLVGGAVRNALLGLPPGDIDLATTMRPEAVTARARAARLRTVPTGVAHGTVTLVVEGLPLEVTTLREDVETDGRHAVVRFGRDFARDAERRDFTINALSAGPDGALHDTTGGVGDLRAARVRFIGDPRTRIREDYLRILRFFRFHATYGEGPLDAAGLAAAVAESPGLDRLSRERVRAETLKLLGARGAPEVVAAIAQAGLLGPVLRGPADVARFARLAARDPDPLLRLTALAARDAADVERLREALRLSNAERDRMLSALRALADVGGDGDRPPDRRRVETLLFDHGRAAAADALALALAASAGGEAAAWDAAAEGAATLPVPAFPFTGRDLMRRGVSGPALGIALARLRRLYAAAGFPDGDGARARLLGEVAPDRPA